MRLTHDNDNFSRPHGSPWRRFFIGMMLAYVLLFLLWRGLVASPLYLSFWWLQVSEIFGMVGYLPAPLLLPGAVALRSRVALLALLVPCAWFGVEYGALFWPNPPSPPQVEQAATLRVMTWNTMGSIGFENNATPDLLATATREQPDLIFLQEAGPNSQTQLQALAEGWPYQMAGMAGGRAHLAIVSKWPLAHAEVVEDHTGCHCIRATVEWQEQAIDIAAIHVIIPNFAIHEWRGLPLPRDFDASRQTGIYDALLADVAASERPLLLVGDFNTNERQRPYARLIDAGLHNAHDESGWGLGLTFPRPGAIRRWWLLPVLRIDHVFYTDQWHARHTWTGWLSPSDHLYVVTDLQLHAP